MVRIARQVAILLLISAVAALAVEGGFRVFGGTWRLTETPPADPYEVTMAMIQEQWNGDVLWVDSRNQEHFDEGHQEGALHLSQESWNDQLFQNFETLTSAGKPIVVYCDAAACELSKKVAEDLRNAGLPDVYFLKGGWPALQAAGQTE